MWATCNVGAKSPEDCGDYFAWGETTQKDSYTESNYYYTPKMSAYETLPLSNDAARANWGGKWRMPTLDECKELINNCTWKYEAVEGVNGYLITSNKNGNSIFLPMAGWKKVVVNSKSIGGYYWTSTYNCCENYVFELIFYSDEHTVEDGISFYGNPVRAVFAK
jgi:hypothetical protein